MITRAILGEARQALRQFRAICITGPRQSGKSTLARILFKGKPYLTFEDPATELLFRDAPSKFLNAYRSGAVFDEVQRVPDLARYLQGYLDRNTARGQFILTGSNNFMLQQQVSQSLAGRVGYLTLLPFSHQELSAAGLPAADVVKNILNGGYPEIWDRGINRQRWMLSYIKTYVQRDVRQLRNITNLALFNRLLNICAHYSGQLVNKDDLARQVGVDAKTIQYWLEVLESSYIIFTLQPWHHNLNKRIVKSPKLYFYDTGLLCTLLQIDNREQLLNHAHYGAVFENWCISEIRKNLYNRGEDGSIFFYRDHLGNELDLILEKAGGPLAVEIKAARKSNGAQLAGLKYWRKYRPEASGVLLYQGRELSTDDPHINYLSWTGIGDL